MGDMANAIEYVRTAYELIADDFVAYPVDTFLKLPMYLQKAGRNDEAWSYFNNLIINGYPNQVGGGVTYMDHSKIYDKMRLFLQREKKADRAVRFGVWSYICWGRGLFAQKRWSELRGFFDEDSIRAALEPLLKKAKRLDVMDLLVISIVESTKEVSEIDLRIIGDNVDELVMLRTPHPSLKVINKK